MEFSSECHRRLQMRRAGAASIVPADLAIHCSQCKINTASLNLFFKEIALICPVKTFPGVNISKSIALANLLFFSTSIPHLLAPLFVEPRKA
jgi:hypothetical protein